MRFFSTFHPFLPLTCIFQSFFHKLRDRIPCAFDICLVVQADALSQEGVPFDVPVPVDCHVQQPFLAHQDHFLPGAGDPRIQ